MRFYGICFCLLTVTLVFLPLLPGSLGDEKKENIQQEEKPLLAVVDDSVIQTEIKTDVPVLAQYPLEKTKDFRIKNALTGELVSVAVEDFVLGAVCSEMPATFHMEALKAQAVSARTWAVYQQLWQKNHPSEELNGADFQADPHNWRGYVTQQQARERFGDKFEEYWSVLTQAVEETKGQVLCFEGMPIAAAYHAISAGKTEAAEYVWGSELDYLRSVDSRGDELAPGFEETVIVTDSDLRTIFSVVNFSGDATSWLEIMERSPSEYVTEIQVGDLSMTGLDFRTALGLRSSCFTITHDEAGFHITTKGYGHGAGLSQYGADFMARQGNSYTEILSHYYQSSQLCVW